ncbi:MAG: prolipoprotein diacylglyceryl transferase [Clostridia bacterium]|nr:prolipoprotein diacylglyceryl transferase [Clostridia bacterium]
MEHVITFPKLGLNFTVNTTAFSIGGFSIQWYGIIIACGFILAVLYGLKMSAKANVDPDRFLDGILVGLVCGIIGARLYYVIFYPGDKYWNNPVEILNIKEGGLAIYGGIIGGLLGGGLTCKFRKLSTFACLDLTVVGFCIGQSIGRWGNFVNQEAFGTVTDLPWGMVSDNTLGQPVHPCFLYESIWMLLGFVLLHIFTRYFRRYDGQTVLVYLVWYGIERFFLEGIRTDSLIIPGIGLRVSQVLSAVVVIAGLAMLFAFRKRTSLTGCGSQKVMELNGIIMENGKAVVKSGPELTNGREDKEEKDNSENAEE